MDSGVQVLLYTSIESESLIIGELELFHENISCLVIFNYFRKSLIIGFCLTRSKVRLWWCYQNKDTKIHPQVFFKKDVLKNLANFLRKHLRWSLKRDSITGVFLKNSRNFYEHYFYKTPPVDASAKSISHKMQGLSKDKDVRRQKNICDPSEI